jgi:2',3'-cyclic-nucleotide 2'-phosphodiesterase (5'-nucleotidase family)
VDTGHEGVAPHEGVAQIVEGYKSRVAPVAERVVGETDHELTRSGGELGPVVADGERAFARTDAALVSPGALRADIDAGPITYAELAQALAYDHPLMRFTMSGAELRSRADGGAHYSGPERLDPDARYSVVASELYIARGRRVGTEVEALDWYLTREGK